MKLYVYLDESGSIHKNSKTRYFAVGGYFTYQDDKVKITSKYRKINHELKIKKELELDSEIKSYDMTEKEKINIFKEIQNIDSFYGCVKIFDKSVMRKEIVESNIFFNYAVKLLITDCIIPSLKKSNNEDIDFIISVDNRNIRVGDLNNLETYLKTEFCINKYDFKVKYYDSRNNYSIQLADLVVNTFYNYYKKESIVVNVMKIINIKKFQISLFLSDNKIKKTYTIKEK